jgi:hypothetical protein
MTTTSLDEGDVLWVDPAVHQLPDRPNGFAFLIQDLLGWGDPGRAVWVRGLLLDGRGAPVRALTLCVPANQPRAVPTTRGPAHTPHAGTDGVAAAENVIRRTPDDPGLVGAPPGYKRRVIR